MNGHTAPPGLLSDEEKSGLFIEERSATSSDLDSNGSGRNDDSPLLGSASRRLQELSSSNWPSSVAKNSVRCLESIPWHALALRIVMFLIPSFLQGRHAREQIRPAKIAPTAYLDGMRGLAALFVYFCHFSYQAFHIAESYGTGDDNYEFLKLPFIRLFYQGPAAVCVFFVISGYALSYRPLKLIRSRATAEFSTAMSSMVFRRGIRLFVPTAMSMLMVALFLQLGVFEWTRDFANDPNCHRNVMEPHAEPEESLYVQLRDWMWTMVGFMHVFTWDKMATRPHYDVHAWTIPLEFRCSLYLFLVFMGTARLRTKLRFLVVSFCAFIAYRHSRWDMCLFLSGMVIAELDHIRGAHVASPALPIDEKYSVAPNRGLKSIVWVSTSIFGLYLLCYPDARAEEAPGYKYLASLVPVWWGEESFRYWQSVGAVLFVLSVGHSPSWQRFFNTPVVQYFGKISYAFYLMHGPVMHMVGYQWEKWAYSVTGVETDEQFKAGFFLAAFFAVPTVIWWADVFWRAVDIPVVKFARWYENKCIV